MVRRSWQRRLGRADAHCVLFRTRFEEDGVSLMIARLLIISGLLAAGLRADPFPSGWAAENMKPVGYSSLNGHGGAFKIVVRRVADKWYAYLGHFWESGWLVLDVTDAGNPKFIKFIAGPDNTNTYQVELHDNLLITALQQRPTNWGGDPKRPHDEGALIWDVSDPVNWKLLSHWKTG